MKNLFRKYSVPFFWLGAFLLLIIPIFQFYLTMPFVGGQESSIFFLAYYLHKWSLLILFLAFILFIYPFILFFKKRKWFGKTLLVLLVLICTFVQLMTKVVLVPNKLFKEPKFLTFKSASESKLPLNTVVIGIKEGLNTKVYPVEYLVYHHKVQDSVGGLPVLVTYCSLCRSGRVFSPILHGKYLRFNVIGVHHNNAIFEDTETHTWWAQESGEGILGPNKGEQLKEFYAEQSTLRSWLERYPETLIMQPEEESICTYVEMNKGFSFSGLEKGNKVSSGEWNPNSIVIGAKAFGKCFAWQWKEVVEKKLINENSFLITVENDSLTFHVLNREINGKRLEFYLDSTNTNLMRDLASQSTWSLYGLCMDGTWKGKQLEVFPSYQEYWHSWKNFHPETMTSSLH